MVSFLAAALVTTLMALPAAAADPQPPAGGAFGFGERAQALWRFPAETETAARTFVFAEVFRGARLEDGPGVAVVGLGSCLMYDYGRGLQEVCRGGGFGHELAPGEFEIDPLLAVATLQFSDTRYEQRVSWKAHSLPRATPGYGVGRGGVAGSGQVVRDCAAGGELFDLPLDAASESWASLSRGGGGGAGPQPVNPEGAEVSRGIGGDGRYTLTVRFPPGQ